MKPRFFTIGMAGHIDHGKTTLTKALTNIDTDRLKEEKERKISIEPGFAPLQLDEYDTTIVDVPGHEKFIRQMIAGVAGIDLVILVVAADEGVMPQTREHLEILSFLGIQHGLIAVTKVDRAETNFMEMKDLVEEDIRVAIKNTLFENAELVYVDSLTGTGLSELKSAIKRNLAGIPQRIVSGTFRLPIDQVFTIQGHGTIVRGTIYEGAVKPGDLLTVLPQGTQVKAKQVQVHNQEKDIAYAGQRAAINISLLSKADLKRGDVLVASDRVPFSDIVDISLRTVRDLQFPLKQRAPIKFHTGTAEVMGKIIYFDRKELSKDTEVLCQVRLDEPVVVKRGDRFVLRRPSPAETIGGGWIIDPLGAKNRFGAAAMQQLERKKSGSPEERLLRVFQTHSLATKEELLRWASLDTETGEEMLDRCIQVNRVLELVSGLFTSNDRYEEAWRQIHERVSRYHASYPMRIGMPKAECLQVLDGKVAGRLVELVVDREIKTGRLVRMKQYLSLPDFMPHLPKQWEQRVKNVLRRLQQDEMGVQPWKDYLKNENIPDTLDLEVKHYLLQQRFVYLLDEKHVIHRGVVQGQFQKLYGATGGQAFQVQEAKNALEVSRKNLILLLELLDQLQITQRLEDQRTWAKAPGDLSKL